MMVSNAVIGPRMIGVAMLTISAKDSKTLRGKIPAEAAFRLLTRRGRSDTLPGTFADTWRKIYWRKTYLAKNR